MLAIKLIKKLKALVAVLKAKAARKQVGALVKCAERTDTSAELCEKRLQLALKIQENLEDRAYTKLELDTQRIEADRKEAAHLLKEINTL